MLIHGARVLITGATGGIGYAIARAFAQRGARLFLAGRDARRLGEIAAEFGGRCAAADLTDGDAASRLATAAGRVDVLVNNAGAGWYGDTGQMPLADIRRLVDVNLVAPLALTRLVLPGLLERRHGHVVFLGSVAGHLGVEREAVYSATKAALATYADALRTETARSGVGVSVVSPGAVATEFFQRRGAIYQRTWPAAISPDAVAAAVVRCVERERADIFVPGWLRIPALLHGGLPAVYRGLAGRFS